ncbi:hypothetical protein [Phyllobacterium sp. SB3]|uniref:hypothetical protein n=1 Tax=Phyllobacterium sp. SB3 TaxID=3156073 RepID=UPI0032AFAD4F
MRNVLARVIVTGAIIAVIGPAIADDLSGPEIKKLVSGERIFLSTPFGTELPLNYKSNGQVSGDVSGISAASMFAPKEVGKWWVEGKKLCQQWPTWYKGRQFCFTIAKTGDNTISWLRDDGAAGTARIGN